jgi:hypothetical protein
MLKNFGSYPDKILLVGKLFYGERRIGFLQLLLYSQKFNGLL